MKRYFLLMMVGIVLTGCRATAAKVDNEPDVRAEDDYEEFVEATTPEEHTEAMSGNEVSESKTSGSKAKDTGSIATDQTDVVFYVDGDNVRATDGSRTDGYTTDGTDVFNEVGTKVGIISEVDEEELFVSKNLCTDYDHLFSWYGWDWIPVDTSKLKYKEFKPDHLEFGYYIGNAEPQSVTTSCVGQDENSIFTSVESILQYAFDSDVENVDGTRVTTAAGTIYNLEYDGKKLIKISTTVTKGGNSYSIYYKIYDKE